MEELNNYTPEKRKAYLDLIRRLIVKQLPEAVKQYGLEGAEQLILDLLDKKKIKIYYDEKKHICWLENNWNLGERK